MMRCNPLGKTGTVFEIALWDRAHSAFEQVYMYVSKATTAALAGCAAVAYVVTLLTRTVPGRTYHIRITGYYTGI